MNFSKALEWLKSGESLYRAGWNGKDIFICLQSPDPNSKMTQPYLYIDTKNVTSLSDNAPRGRVPWLASQTDLLAEDWEILNDRKS